MTPRPAAAARPVCLIAGCGDVGSRAGQLLAARGWHVVGIRRRGEMPAPIEPLHVDLGDPLALRSALAHRRIDALVHLPTPDERTPDAYRRVYGEGLRHVLEALPEPPMRVVWVGSTAVHGDSGAAWQDESTPPRPDAWNGEVLLETERALRARVPGAVVLRLAGLYGPGRDALVRRARGGAPCRGAPPHWTNRIHVDDAAAAVAHLVGLGEALPLYLGVDDEPATECTVLRYIAECLGVPAERYRDDPTLPATGKRLSGARLRASGLALRYPSYREGYAALIAASGPAPAGRDR